MCVPSFDMSAAVRAVRTGKVLVYPTETFWALGGNACLPDVARRVAGIKGRPGEKPLPVIIGKMADLKTFFLPSKQELEIASLFWPGPLTIAVKSGPDLDSGLSDRQGRVSVRWSAHGDACRLADLAGVPLISTSANLSGDTPVRDFSELQEAVKNKADFCLQTGDAPGGGLPSTVIEVTGKMRCRILRPGKISREEIRKKGLECPAED
jgi:L-threonylcarbamoyladenylate synthase